MSRLIADSTQIFKCRLYFKVKFKFSQRYIAKKIGAACNSRIPQANLHAGLNFVNTKKIAVIILFIFEIFVG